MKNDKFPAMTLKPSLGTIGLINRPEPQNCGLLLIKTTLKHENDKFLAMPLKPVSGPIGLVNRPRTKKLWFIAHENGPKT